MSSTSSNEEQKGQQGWTVVKEAADEVKKVEAGAESRRARKSEFAVLRVQRSHQKVFGRGAKRCNLCFGKRACGGKGMKKG